MFEGLDDINWASLTHAFGSAEDVPPLLRACASRDPAVAEAAVGEFFGNIWHQGTVYEATAYAVPYLVELLIDQGTHDRFSLVVLLAFIAQGTSYMEVHDRYVHYMMERPELQDRLARELRWKADARAAVQARADSYWRLMDDSDLRITVPFLLSKLPGEAEHICRRTPLLLHSQTDPLLKASMLICWATCQPPGEDGVVFFRTILQKAETPLLQLAAALGMLRVGVEETDINEALRVYFDAVQDPSPYDPQDVRWFWGEGEFFALFHKWLPHFGPAAKEATLLRLPSILPRLENYTATIFAAETMPWAFSADCLPRHKADLTALQLFLLQSLSRQTNVCYGDSLIKSVLASLDLPNDMKRLKAFLD